MVLNCRKDVVFKKLLLNSEELDSSQYDLTEKDLTLKSPPAGNFTVNVTVEIKPQENTSLSGLYKSSGNFCT